MEALEEFLRATIAINFADLWISEHNNQGRFVHILQAHLRPAAACRLVHRVQVLALRELLHDVEPERSQMPTVVHHPTARANVAIDAPFLGIEAVIREKLLLSRVLVLVIRLRVLNRLRVPIAGHLHWRLEVALEVIQVSQQIAHTSTFRSDERGDDPHLRPSHSSSRLHGAATTCTSRCRARC